MKNHVLALLCYYSILQVFVRIVRFIVFGESSAATYYKSIHQFTRKETLCRKKILKKLLKFGLLFLLLLELLFLIFPNNNFLLCCCCYYLFIIIIIISFFFSVLLLSTEQRSYVCRTERTFSVHFGLEKQIW